MYHLDQTLLQTCPYVDLHSAAGSGMVRAQPAAPNLFPTLSLRQPDDCLFPERNKYETDQIKWTNCETLFAQLETVELIQHIHQFPSANVFHLFEVGLCDSSAPPPAPCPALFLLVSSVSSLLSWPPLLRLLHPPPRPVLVTEESF